MPKSRRSSQKKRLPAAATTLTSTRCPVSATGPELQWTCRLRDVLERLGFRIFKRSAKLLSEIREAKFTCADGCFPKLFRWDIFTQCYNQSRFDPSIFLHPSGDASYLPIDANCASYSAIRALSGTCIADLARDNIDVLWLSKTIFISPIFFRLMTSPCVDDYELKFQPSDLKFFVYSLSSFERDEPDIPSSLPADFLRHVTALLPVGYFSNVLVHRFRPQRCPLQMVFQILSSVVPHDRYCSPAREGRQTTFTIGASHEAVITEEELKCIVSHPFHRTIRLAFYEDSVQFNGSVSLSTLKEILQQPRSLRAINLPRVLVKAEGTDIFSLFFQQLTMNSSDLSIGYERGLMPRECLHSIVAAYPITDIRMTFAHHFWDHDPRSEGILLRRYIQPLLLDQPGVERLLIRFNYHFNYDMVHGQVLRAMPSILSACMSRKLCFVNISLARRYESASTFFTRHLDNAQWTLNNTLFPRLVLNYWRNHLPKPLEGRVVQFAIKAVNGGNIYRKTTNLVPSDMGTANAGLIFSIVKKLRLSWPDSTPASSCSTWN
jgi:hypothetical protein